MEQGEASNTRKRKSRWDVKEAKVHRLCGRTSLDRADDDDAGNCEFVSTNHLRQLFFTAGLNKWYRQIHVPNPVCYPEPAAGETLYVETIRTGPSMKGLQAELEQQRQISQLRFQKLEAFQALAAPSFARMQIRALVRYAESWKDPSREFGAYDLIRWINQDGWVEREGWRHGRLSNGKEFRITKHLLRTFPQMIETIDDISALVVHSISAANLVTVLHRDILRDNHDNGVLNMGNMAFHAVYRCEPAEAHRHLSYKELNRYFAG